MTSYRHG